MIVFCHLLNDRSGSPTVLRATIEALNATEDDLLFVGSKGRGVLEETGVSIRRYWYRRSRYRVVTLITYLVSQIELYRALVRSKNIASDATVFVNTLLPFAAMLWGRRTGRRVVVHVHEVSITPVPLRWFLKNCAQRCADVLIYVSHDHYARLPIEGPPAVILPNAVGPAVAARAQATVCRRDRQFRVLMLASLRGYKGIGEFIALAQGMQDRTDIAFDLVLNAEEDEVTAFVKNNTDVAGLTIHPRTDDPAHFYSRADLVLNLSRTDEWIETFGLTLVEAMTFGLPVIAPPVGGPTEIVTHGVEGYCIDSRDISALRMAVLKLVDDCGIYAAMSQAARKRAQDFSFDTYAANMRAALNTVVDK